MSSQNVNVGRQNVHKKNGKRNPFGINAEITDEKCQNARADTKNKFAFGGTGGRHVIRCHKDSADDQTARKNERESFCEIKAFRNQR